MNSQDIRTKFLEFFKGKMHKVVPSAPIVVQNDPTLMFTNAGMNQFKDYFLGNKESEVPRIADTQKCLRVSGKHNDLEEVGLDTYHHTMFEMLGNWSFGDYFKKDAIDWAWELLTEVYHLPKDRMYATVFEGDKSENLAADVEAREIWKSWIPEERILNGNKKDNFWEMGDVGPCGPCSEIHIDLRTEEEIRKQPGHELVNNDHPLVVEIWNLVFMQFNRLANGSLANLPARHVDTGMGFERLAMAVQGKQSNYDTDVFQPLIQLIANKAGKQYGLNAKSDVAMRVVADHIRAISFCIADGQLPGNAKAGYVIRRILRRAVRYGYTYLNFKEPFLNELVASLADQFSTTFPELKAQEDFVIKVIREEELSFLRTLEKGLAMIDKWIDEGQSKTHEISGHAVFQLYDTYGFPKDLTLLIFREKDAMDLLNAQWEKDFDKSLKEQKERSRSAAEQTTGDWVILDADASSEFLGYDQLSTLSRIIRYRKIDQKSGAVYQLVLDQTPFYSESGGQVGDTGMLSNEKEKLEIFDTRKENDLIIHFTKTLPEGLDESFMAQVDEKKRSMTQNNHTATHLLHAALRSVLGDHVQQRGSLVNDKVLRFDFSHFSKVTKEELQSVEAIVNERIRENIPIDEKRNVPLEDAKSLGAMALFGEKYGEFVRVITFDENFSVELCGGTHVPATGVIGSMKIISESSVAAGVRRIEAITAATAESYVDERLELLSEVETLLKHPTDIRKAITQLLEERSQLQKRIEEHNQEQGGTLKKKLLSEVRDLNGIKLIAQEIEVPDANVLKQLSFELKNEIPEVLVLLGASLNQKPLLSVIMDDKLVENFGLNASELVRIMAREIQGGGGGQAFYATAGGKNLAGLQKALEVGTQWVEEKMKIEIK